MTNTPPPTDSPAGPQSAQDIRKAAIQAANTQAIHESRGLAPGIWISGLILMVATTLFLLLA